jgi:hypothetical protein
VDTAENFSDEWAAIAPSILSGGSDMSSDGDTVVESSRNRVYNWISTVAG